MLENAKSCGCSSGKGVSKKNVGSTERALSAVTGAALAGLAVNYGRKGSKWGAITSALAGASLLLRGATGRCPVYKAASVNTARESNHPGLNIYKSIIINKTPEELFAFWRDVDNLPKFMDHIDTIKKIDERLSHWRLETPVGYLEWESAITAERDGEYIAWKSLPGSELENLGSVQFRARPRGGTEVKVHIRYNPPAGRVGKILAAALGQSPDQEVAGDLHRFKQLMETGEIASTRGQPFGDSRKRSSTAVERLLTAGSPA